MAPTPSKEVINIGGVAANVYSLPGATETSTPVAVLFFLHGRTQRATDYEWVAYSTIRPVPVVFLLLPFWPHSYDRNLAEGYPHCAQADSNVSVRIL